MLITPWISWPRHVCFELGGRPIAWSRVQSLSVVDVFNEDADRLAGVVEITIFSAVNLLLFECLHEALSLGIVVGITHSTHARLDVMGSKHLGILAARILYATIRMMDQTSR